MNKLYYVPLGCSARGYFINEIAEKGWESSLLVLPSGVLQSRAFKEGAVRVKILTMLQPVCLMLTAMQVCSVFHAALRSLLSKKFCKNMPTIINLTILTFWLKRKALLKQ